MTSDPLPTPDQLEPADHSYIKNEPEIPDYVRALLPEHLAEEVRIRSIGKKYAKHSCRFCHGDGIVAKRTPDGDVPGYCICVMKRVKPDILFPPTPPGERTP